MKIPLIVHLSFWLLFVPIAVAAFRWRSLDTAHRAVVIWLALLVLAAICARLWVWYVDRTNNMIVSYFFTPFQGIAILWGLAEWQVRPLARRTIRYSIPLLCVWWLLVFLYLEDRQATTAFGGPVLGLVALAASLYALVTRFQSDTEPVLTSSWAWILAGVAIHFATNAWVTILQAVLIARNDIRMLIQAGILKAWVDVFSIVFFTGGFLWARPTRFSGISSSSPLSR